MSSPEAPQSHPSKILKLSQPTRQISPISVRSLTNIFEEKGQPEPSPSQSVAQRGRVMSYQQTYRTVSTPVQSSVYNPTHQSSFPRKPASARSISPLPSYTSSSPAPVYRNQPTNHLHSPHSPNPSNPLSSFPLQPVSLSPSITPPVPDYQQPNYRQQPRNFFDSPASATSASFPSQQVEVQKRAHSSQEVQSKPFTQPAAQPLSHSSPASSYASAQPSILPHQIDTAFQQCFRIQTSATTHHAKRPFAALLLDADHDTVLLSHNSISHFQHAESELARLAGMQYSQKFLEKCTLVTTWEPCAMCAGTIYWTGIGRVMYGASEAKLKELTGPNNEDNMTMDLPCRTVFNSGQRAIEVIGPVSGWEDKIVAESQRWWRENNLGKMAEKGRHERERSMSRNGTRNSSGGYHEKSSSISVYNPNDSVLGSIGEDGEYQADLKIDWMP